MSDAVDGSTLTDEERSYLRAAAAVMATIADATGVAPGLNNDSIADRLDWPVERARRVARGLARTGLMATQGHVRERAREATEAVR